MEINTRVRNFLSEYWMVRMLEQLRIYTTRDIWKFFQIALALSLMQFWENFQISDSTSSVLKSLIYKMTYTDGCFISTFSLHSKLQKKF